MRRGILIFIALLPAAAMAQQRDLALTNTGTGRAVSAPPSALLTGNNEGSYPEPGSTRDVASTFLQAPNPSQPQKGSQPQTTKPGDEIKRPSIAGSMVGYIDSAIVGSQVRVRFDDAFHDSAPDRAEFFYSQCSCSGLGTGPDFPGASTDLNFQQIYLQVEYAPVSRFSVFVELPFRWIEPQPPVSNFIPNSFDSSETPSTQSRAGNSDVRAGIKLALAASSNYSLTLQAKAYFPSGKSSLGLGTDHYSIEPSLLYYQRISRRWSVESQIGDWHPIGGTKSTVDASQTLTNFAGDVFMYGIGPSYRLIDGERFKLAPVVELFGWRVLAGLQTSGPFPDPSGTATCLSTGQCAKDAGGTNIVNIKAGVRATFGGRNSIYAGFGQAITQAVWYKHIVRIEYRYSF